MHVSTSEKELQYKDYAYQNSAFTFRDPSDRLARQQFLPQAGTANKLGAHSQDMQNFHQTSKKGAETMGSRPTRPTSNTEMVAEMLRRRREERETRQTSVPQEIPAYQQESPQTIRQLIIRDEKPAIAHNIHSTFPYPEAFQLPPPIEQPQDPPQFDVSDTLPPGPSDEYEYIPPLPPAKEAPLPRTGKEQLEPNDMRNRSQTESTYTQPGKVAQQNVFDRLVADAKKKRGSKNDTFTQDRKLGSQIRKSPRTGQRIEDRLMMFKKERENRLVQERVRKKSREMNELQSSPKISPVSDKITKSSPGAYKAIVEKYVEDRRIGVTKTPNTGEHPILHRQVSERCLW